jgi:3-dehydroquinate synthase
MKKISLDLGDRSYPIFIDRNIINLETMQPYLSVKSICIVSNETVAPLYLESVKKNLSEFRLIEVILKDGEQFKNFDSLNEIFSCLLQNQFNRDSMIIALGGGVVGDIAGFAAASFMRGIPFIQIPTTLLSQVDSSVGGKTGINHELGKNMIGAFYQPKAVIIDVEVLHSLPQREISAGLAEIIKYGLIWDQSFFEFLEDNIDGLANLDYEKLQYAIHRSCEIKSEIVSKDEKESGIRAILNLGHTFGHAIENCLGYGEWLHGEAVGCGMIMAAKVSLAHEWITKNEFNRIQNIIEMARLPIQMPQIPRDKFLQAMQLDKKNKDGEIRLVLQQGIGKAIITSDFQHEILSDVIADAT